MFTLTKNNRNSKAEIFITVAITVIAILTLGMTKFSARPVADHSYDAVEQMHASRLFASLSNLLSYDRIEAIRANRTSNASSSYDAIEALRNARGLTADRSYDAVEQVRLAKVVSFPASASSYEAIEQLRANRGLAADRSYDLIEALRLQH
jgi:hypothetical protein